MSAKVSQWEPIADIARKVQAGELKASDLVEQALKTIDDKKEFNAVLVTVHDRARERAKALDEQVSRGESVGKLAGVPFIAKDNFLTFGSETTAASNILKGFEAPYQATAIDRLEAEGAIVVGKANLDAFAHGGSTENSDFMTTKNPHDPTRVPGGSSGGSAAAVILELAPFAVGTDTGGSIRQPASFCGAVGFKPTYGLVSRSGVVAMISSTDVIGPLTRTVEDAALVLDVMAGRDELDGTSIERDPAGYVIPASDLSVLSERQTGSEPNKNDFSFSNWMPGQARHDSDPKDHFQARVRTRHDKPVKIGVIKEYMDERVDPDVKATVQTAIDKLKVAGADVQEVSLPSLPLALACYYIICPAEVSSNLSRYDGQRYGFSNKDAKNLDDSYSWSRSEGFGKEAKRRIMIGTYVLSSGYYDAYYRKAQQLRTKLINEFAAAFEQVDFLAGPVAPTVAFKIGENASDPLQMYLQDIMTVAVSLVGIPAVSIPAGMAQSMPVGLQLMAPQKQDKALLAVAHKTEELLL